MSYKQLIEKQRYHIRLSLQKGLSKKEIADDIKVHVSTVYREIKRNKGEYQYHDKLAQRKYEERKCRMRAIRSFTIPMRKRIFTLLVDRQWSPEQIKGYLNRRGEPCVSVQTIYSYIRFDRKCGGTLWKHCRHTLKHKRRASAGGNSPIKDRKMIDQMPEWLANAVFGVWEMDCIIGRGGKSVILTMVEKNTGFLLIRKLPKGKNAKDLARRAYAALLPYKDWIKAIVTDNGSEFAEFKYIEKWLNTSVFFTHPYSSWEKGSIENANGLIRQYLPKGLDFNTVSDDEILSIQYKLNDRPRKKLGFFAPKDAFFRKIKLISHL